MTRIRFTKPPLSCSDQVDLLLSRKMQVPDRERAIRNLERINYYRLGFYWYDFETDHETHEFNPKTNFDDVVTLYDFDHELRLIVLAAIGQIEIAFRAQWVQSLSMDHGAHAHLNSSIHDETWPDNFSRLLLDMKFSKESYVKELMKKYEEQTPPIWAICEIMPFGRVSKWYKSLNPEPTKAKVGKFFALSVGETESCMHHLNAIRNTCAHHNRLWNQKLSRVQPKHPKQLTSEIVEEPRLYNTIVLILFLLSRIDSTSQFKK